MVTKDLGLVTAYAYAVAGGYTGTEEEFQALLGNIAIDLAEIENLSVTVTTLPAGSSATASYDSGVLSLGIPKGDKGDSGDVANVAPEFSTSTPYDEGDYVIYNDLLYKFKTAKAAGAWDSTKVEAKTVGDELTALKEDIKDNYAKNDGYYDGMTVGNAEQIVGTVFEEDDTAYNYRTTGGSAEVGDRAYVDAIVGGSLPWNQLVIDPSLTDTSKIHARYSTFTVSNGIVTAIPDSSGTERGCRFDISNYVIGHKFLIGAWVKTTKAGHINVSLNGVSIASVKRPITAGVFTYMCNVFLSESDNQSPTLSLYQNDSLATTDELQYTKPQVHDLTAMFGSTIADYIYGLETAHAGDGVAWFRRYFPKPYYAYHAVGMEHVNATAAKTVGFNQWDEEWELGGINNDTGALVDASNAIRSKNYIPVLPQTSYYVSGLTSGILRPVYYDANKNFIGTGYWQGGTSNNPQTTPANCRYMKFKLTDAYGTTYKHDICISIRWDNSRDGDYEPYNLHTYPLADLTLRGIPLIDESGNLYFDGDRYLHDGTVERRYGIVDLGTLNWSKETGYFSSASFYANVPNALGRYGTYGTTQICSKYTSTDAITAEAVPDKSCRFGVNSGNLNVFDSAFADMTAEQVKTALSGVYLVYELATPTTEEADPYQYPMVVDNWGTEEFVDGLVESGDRDVAIPVGHETKYPPNLKDKLESAANNPDADGAYILTHDGGSNTYTPLASNPTIQNIIARLEALEGGGE